MNITTPQPTASQGSSRQAPVIEGGCPHGAPRGACPLCSGAGGGGGGGKKQSGLMGWNEAYAVWNALRIERTRNEDYLKGLALNQARIQQEGMQPPRNPLMNFLARYAPALAGFLANPPQVLATMGRGIAQATSSLQNTLGTLRNTLAQAMGRAIDITDKLATILGDGRKFLEDIWHHNVENLKALFSQTQLSLLLQHVDGLLKQILRQFAPRQVFQTVKNGIRSVLKKIFGRAEEEDEDSLAPLSS